MAHSLVFKNIPSNEINKTPFSVFKNWTVSHTDYSSSFGVQIRKAILDKDWETYNYAAGFTTPKPNPDGTDQKSLWYNVNGMYYKEDKSNLDIEYSPYMMRNLHATASYIQIPQQIFGEGIKLGSVNITNGTTNLIDDKLGHLIDTALDTGSMVPSEWLIAYWGFNDKFKYKSTSNQESGTINDITLLNQLAYKNIKFVPGLTTTGLQTVNTGLKAQLNGNGCMWINNAENFNFKVNEDFALSLWVDLPASQSNASGSYNWLVSKEGDVEETFYNKKTKEATTYYVDYQQCKYPYSIKVYNQNSINNGKIEVSRCDVTNTPTITSVTQINDAQQHHICFNKTGSRLELWIDGTLEGFTTDTTNENTHNNAILTLASNGYDNGTGLSGSLDEVRFYSRGISPTEISSLSNMDYVTGSAYNTAIVGNVFYPQGTMVISDPRPKYQNVLLGNNFDYTSSISDNFLLKFRSTLTLVENEILCRVSAGEFNFTSNPTIRQYNDKNSQFAKSFVTGSEWHPYVTTIGLYDEYGRLLVVGKTANAIPIKDNVETTFIVRYDE
jgi:hypothetical protein